MDLTETKPTKSLMLTTTDHHQPPEGTEAEEEEETALMVVIYKECLKNHAASLGGHALDGCGEFMPSGNSSSSTASLKCAACGCHRNFHRRDGPLSMNNTYTYTYTVSTSPFLQQRQQQSSSSDLHSVSPSLSPPQSISSPIPFSYYSSAPPILLAMSNNLPGPSTNHRELNHCSSVLNPTDATEPDRNPNNARSRRSRTKFSSEQKLKMRDFADELGWKIQRCDEKHLQGFCDEIGVSRGVFKVWMHNNKYSFGKKTEMDSLNNNDNNIADNGRVGFDNNGSSSSS